MSELLRRSSCREKTKQINLAKMEKNMEKVDIRVVLRLDNFSVSVSVVRLIIIRKCPFKTDVFL